MSPKEPTAEATVAPPPAEQEANLTPFLPGIPVELQPWFRHVIPDRPITIDDLPLRLANVKQLWRGHSFLGEAGCKLQEGQDLADFLRSRLAGKAEGGGDPASRAHAHASVLCDTISTLHLICTAALNRGDDRGMRAPSAPQPLRLHHVMFDAWVLVELLRWQRDASREDIQAILATERPPATFGSESGLTMHEAVWNLADEICRVFDAETEGRLSIRPLAEQSLSVEQWLSGFGEAWSAAAKALDGRFPTTQELKTVRDRLKSEFRAARGHPPRTGPQGQHDLAQTRPSGDGNDRASANQDFRHWLDWLRRTPAPTVTPDIGLRPAAQPRSGEATGQGDTSNLAEATPPRAADQQRQRPGGEQEHQEQERQERTSPEALGATCEHVGSHPATAEMELPFADFRFERVGSVWHIRFGDEETEIADNLTGLRFIALLLEKRHIAIPALQLEGHPETALPRSQTDAPVLSKELKADLKKRLIEIVEAMKDVEEFQDRTEYQALEAEKKDIEDQLKAALGRFGKDRMLTAGNEGKKAADRVRKAIAAVRQKLKTEECGMPKLAAYFKRTIKKEGLAFAYRPGPSEPEWHISV